MKRAVSLRVVWEGGVLNSPVKKASSDAVGFLDDRAAQLHTRAGWQIQAWKASLLIFGQSLQEFSLKPRGFRGCLPP